MFKRPNCHCKFIMEPTASETDNLITEDLSLAIKLEVTPITKCWPPETFVFLLPDKKEKERWCTVLNTLFSDSSWMQIHGDFIFKQPENLNINCLVNLNENNYLIGTDNGLYSTTEFTYIESPKQIQQIALMKTINAVIMIADEKQFLLYCDLNHVTNLIKYPSCTKPTLNYTEINLKNLNGFQFLQVSKYDGKICVATQKQLIIAEYVLELKEFVPLRVLDTAEPTSCALFTRNDTLIVGADKFFEVDLELFTANEFLDSKMIDSLYKMKSFPINIVAIGKQQSLMKYLCCFNEFAVFVDESGRCLSEENEIKWKQLPIVIHYVASYLYVVHFQGLEIIKVNEDCSTCVALKINLQQPRFIGSNEKGVYLLTKNGEVRFFDGRKLDATADTLSTTTEESETSDRFSFTSSVVQCLDNCSETGSESNYQTKKVTFTNL